MEAAVGVVVVIRSEVVIIIMSLHVVLLRFLLGTSSGNTSSSTRLRMSLNVFCMWIAWFCCCVLSFVK